MDFQEQEPERLVAQGRWDSAQQRKLPEPRGWALLAGLMPEDSPGWSEQGEPPARSVQWKACGLKLEPLVRRTEPVLRHQAANLAVKLALPLAMKNSSRAGYSAREHRSPPGVRGRVQKRVPNREKVWSSDCWSEDWPLRAPLRAE